MFVMVRRYRLTEAGRTAAVDGAAIWLRGSGRIEGLVWRARRVVVGASG